jgi:hypothetical protein
MAFHNDDHDFHSLHNFGDKTYWKWMIMEKKQIILNILLISWAIGLSGRFIFENLSGFPTYTANTFDLIFDWSGLFLLGILSFIYLIYRFHLEYGKNVKMD